MFKKLFVVLTAFIISPETALALGFGDITVFSKLNEPLKAHIELLDSESTPTDEISVKNASLSIYRRANLPRPEVFNKVRFKTTKLANGSIIAELTSKQPIKEPFITFIADLKWRNGHLNREYTFLLDPPKFVLKNTRSISNNSNKANETTKKPSAAALKSIPSTKKLQIINPEINHSAIIANHDGTETYKTRPADTLWEIAKKIKPDNRVTSYQTMQALFVLNPDAFINSNINLLKQNQILKVPSVNEVLQINGRKSIEKISLNKAKKAQTTSQAALKKQPPIEPVAVEPSDVLDAGSSDAKKGSKLPDEAQLKIIPPTRELLNKSVTSQEDLQLIKKALKTSIDTIQLLHSENESLAARINQLTKKLTELDSHNEKLNVQIAEISTLLKNKQTAVPANNNSSNPSAEKVNEATRAVNTHAAGEKPTSVEIQSDINKSKNSRSFVRELLTSPVITFALAIFTIIILLAILFTIRKQNEKRKQKKKNAYIPPSSEVLSNQQTPPEKTDNTNGAVRDEVEPAVDKITTATDEKPEEEMDFFEYFEKKINAPEESSKTSDNETNAPEPSMPADSDNRSKTLNNAEAEINFSLDITDEEIQDYEKHISQSYKLSKKNVPDSTIGEIDTYIAYGNYKTAEKLVLREIQNAPDNKNLHLKLFECYSLSNKRYEFMQHIKKIIDILNIDMVLRHRVETIYQQTWNEPLNINKFT